MAWGNKISPSKILLICLFAFIVGIFAGNFFVLDAFYIFCVLLFLILFLIFNFKNKKVLIVFLILICFCFGLWRQMIASPDLSDPQKIYHYYNQQVLATGKIVEVKKNLSGQKLTVDVLTIRVDNPAYRQAGNTISASGKILATTDLYPAYDFGQSVEMLGTIKQPQKINDFDYGQYLSAKHVFALMSFPEIKSAPSKNYFSIYYYLYFLRDKLSAGLARTIVEPQASLFQAMLFNDMSNLSPDWNTIFSLTGVTHIIAISGSHLVLIMSLLSVLLIGFGLRRQQTFWPIVIIIILYIMLVGAPASAVRSGIMGLMVLYTQKIGRISGSLNLILLACVLILLFNPASLMFDAGFQLSFLAVIGLAYLLPILKKYFARLPEFWQFKEMFLMTLSAQIMTLPLIIFSFHKLSLISFLANLLVLPIVPFLMAWGFINSLVSLVYAPLGTLCGYVSYFAGGYFLWTVHALSKWPWGCLEIQNFNSLMLVGVYVLIICWLVWENRKIKMVV
ncbi:MAG: ComEC/Rec2 family competence protein [bacterium]